jgi:DNA helicase II / ATP-dependent DNA helicase PcrA
VLDVARAVIDKNSNRTRKALFTERQGGTPVQVFEAYSDSEEAEYVVTTIEEQRRKLSLSYKDFAIMYRTNAQSRAMEEACIREGVPYKLVGGIGFYKRREVRDLLAYLRLVNNLDDSVSFSRVINIPKRGIGKKSVEDFQAWAAKNRYTTSRALEALADGEATPLNSSAVKKFIEFHRMILEWRQEASSNNLAALLDSILIRTHYTMHLQETSDDNEQFMEREENVKELRGLLDKNIGMPLNEFLEEIALVADIDTVSDALDAVTLLTLHAAKGLEYPVVFLTGLEEGLLPHMRSFDEPEGMAEERRLMYVGITRAMQRLYLTYAFRRLMYGDSTPGRPSRFLADIPLDRVEGAPAKILQNQSRRSFEAETRWDDSTERRSGSLLAGLGRPNKPASLPAASAPKKENLKYKTGQKVRHAKFGEGVVIHSLRMGSDEEVTVSFSDKKIGLKRLAASFANLEILGEK